MFWKMIGLVGLLVFAGCSTSHKNKINSYRLLACQTDQNNEKDYSPWHIRNLFDCKTDSLFIPYQLWTGGYFDGNKNAQCAHNADFDFIVDGDSPTNITGPKEWWNPKEKENQLVWVRRKKDNSKTQYFTCHKKGIGRVYDSRGKRIYRSGRCKFPAGFEWVIGKKRACNNTAIEIIDVVFDGNNELHSIEFKWWVDHVYDHRYLYVRGLGLVKTWNQGSSLRDRR